MYDGYHDDWHFADAQHAAEQEHGCGDCQNIEQCRAEGFCVKHMDTEGEAE